MNIFHARTGRCALGNLTAGFVYDPNDNLITKCEGGAVTRSDTACTGATVTNLTYDALNALTQTAKTGLPAESYVYDDQGRRIQTTVGVLACQPPIRSVNGKAARQALRGGRAKAARRSSYSLTVRFPCFE